MFNVVLLVIVFVLGVFAHPLASQAVTVAQGFIAGALSATSGSAPVMATGAASSGLTLRRNVDWTAPRYFQYGVVLVRNTSDHVIQGYVQIIATTPPGGKGAPECDNSPYQESVWQVRIAPHAVVRLWCAAVRPPTDPIAAHSITGRLITVSGYVVSAVGASAGDLGLKTDNPDRFGVWTASASAGDMSSTDQSSAGADLGKV